jgi:hypothetical protein
MAQYFFGITREEKDNILNQHKTIYDGYVTRYGQNNEQPLYIQDFANDKEGITVSNNGTVKKYTNMNINESFDGRDMIGDGDFDLKNGTVDMDSFMDYHFDDGGDEIEYVSLGKEEGCDDDIDIEIEIGEGWDSPLMKKYYDDYTPEKFRKLPKVFGHGMSDYEGTELVGDEEDEFDSYSDYYNDDFNYDKDYDEEDDFEPLTERHFDYEVDEDILPDLTEKLNESLDMFKRFRKYN